MPQPAAQHLERPEGHFELRRYPARSRETLQAWCSADLLLLDAARNSEIPAAHTLVVNDEHGTLATVLTPGGSWTDSALSARATADNLRRNGLPTVPVLWSTTRPGGHYQLVLLRIPKQLEYFEYQLSQLQQCLPPGALLICGGMDKHLSPHTATLLERYFGPVTRHRGARKARLFSARRDDSPPHPNPTRGSYYCDPLKAELVTGANVFSRDGLDMGSRLLLAQLQQLEPVERGADLACGNGVLGIATMQAGLCQAMTFCDESAMAIAAAKDNCDDLLDNRTGLQFLHSDGLTEASEPFDLIVCNPPFHLGHSVDDFAGRRLLQQCASHLSPGGTLCVVANQHLPYLPVLRREFAEVDEMARSRKFVVWLARAGC